jgi:hypothetical protein
VLCALHSFSSLSQPGFILTWAYPALNELSLSSFVEHQERKR